MAKPADFPGEFEQMIMLAILRRGDDAYGLAVLEELTDVAGREPSTGSLYTTLERLERKGWLQSRTAESSPARGGRPRRYFQVTAAGAAALRRSREALMALWDGVAESLEGR